MMNTNFGKVNINEVTVMEKVFVVTDSTADIPKELVNSLGITVVPLKVHFKDGNYLDGVTIKPDEFYKKLETSEELPTTSQPSPIDFVETYKKLADGNNAKIISIHLSSALSGTVQSGLLAKSMIEEEGIEVAVIDSKKASYSFGIVVVAVAEAIQNGSSFEEAVQLAKELLQRTQIYFLVDSLTHLHKGGRIGRAASIFGSLLNIKPILSLNEQGEVFAFDKVRGRNKANTKILEHLSDYAKGKKVRVGISHASNIEEAKKFEKMIREELDVQDFVITDIGSVIGTHVGPGALAIVIYTID